MNKALLEGPQNLTRRGDCVILLNEKDYLKLVGKKMTLKQYLMSDPDLEGLDLRRDKTVMRVVEL